MWSLEIFFFDNNLSHFSGAEEGDIQEAVVGLVHLSKFSLLLA